MRIKHLFVALLITLVLATACSTQATSVAEPKSSNAPIETPDRSDPVQVPVVDETSIPVETAGPNCLGDEINPIGQTIADEYETTSYEQVMTWFCNGAEFEDILTALETEAQTDTSVDEMLKMLADGFTWDEIWQQVGLTD